MSSPAVFPDDQVKREAHYASAVGTEEQSTGANDRAKTHVPVGSDALLLIFADALDDLERVRIATENRARALHQVKGMDDTPEEQRLLGLVDALAALEHGAELELKRALRQHPLGNWVKRTVGVGEKQGARLLAATGDPYWNTLHDRPRTVSELWAYCGYHVVPGQFAAGTHPMNAGDDRDTDHPTYEAQGEVVGVAARRRKGERANWSNTAKMRAHLVAVSCMKQAASPYRPVFEERRAHTAVTHPEWTPGHSMNDALRIVAKAILKDLWLEARTLHEVAS